MMHAYSSSNDCDRKRCGAPRNAARSSTAAHPLARVHQSVGNRALTRTLQRAGPEETGGGGGGGKGTKQQPPPSATFASNCNEYHRCNIIEGLAAAKRVVDGTIAALAPIAAGTTTSGSVVTRLTTEFHDTNAQTRATSVMGVYRPLRTELDAAIRFNCDSGAEACTSKDSGFVGAYTTCSAGAEIGVCSTFHLTSCEEQTRYLIHEYAHHLPGICADIAYSDQAAFATLTADQAMANADSFAFFAVNVSSPSPCVDCAQVIQLGGPRRRRY